MSSFDEKPAFKKFIVTASLTAEQREEFDALKEIFNLKTDGALVKRGLAELAHAVEENRAQVTESDEDEDEDIPAEVEDGVVPDAWAPTPS